MSHMIHDLRDAVSEINALQTLSSERKKIECRSLLLALEKMCKDIRTQLLQESRDLKQERKNNRLKKKALVENVEEQNE